MIKYVYGLMMTEKGKGPVNGMFEPSDDNTKMIFKVGEYSATMTKDRVRDVIRYLEEWMDE